MRKQTAALSLKRTTAFMQAIMLAAAIALPATLMNGSASGAQLVDRYIDMSANQTSEGSGRDSGDAFGQDVTYRVGFNVNQAHANIEGIVVEFCSNSPIIEDATCNTPAGFNVNEGSLVVTAVTGITGSWAIHANTDTNTLILTKGAGDNLAANDPVAFDLGTSAAADGITNPTATGTFYARIVTYLDETVADDYVAGTPGASRDDGGIALSVNNELTITARVQEVLEFCIGTDTSSTLADVTGDDCGDVAGTNLSLGVVDASSTQKTDDADILNDGVAMLRTNALSGAVVSYKAEQETSSGKLKQATLACSGVDLFDPCFNSTGTTGNTIVSGTEEFGMSLYDQNELSGGATTNALVCDDEYDGGAGATGCPGSTPTHYAWQDDGSFDTIAASTGPVDDEKVSINFAATASPTTPTGLYTVTANFVATATF